MNNIKMKVAKVLAQILDRDKGYTNQYGIDFWAGAYQDSISLQFIFSPAESDGTTVLVLDDMPITDFLIRFNVKHLEDIGDVAPDLLWEIYQEEQGRVEFSKVGNLPTMDLRQIDGQMKIFLK